MNGAIAPPTEDPLSKKAVAKARSCLGNHSETAFVAAGQQETKQPETVETACEWCKHRNQRVPRDCKGQTAASANAIHEAAKQALTDRIGNAERNHNVGIVGIRPVVL